METLDRDTVTMETLDCDTVTMETLDCDTVTMETLDHDTVTMKTLDRDTVTMETLDRDTVTMETLDRDTVTMETLDHDTVRMETIYNENNCTATMEALDSKSSLSVKMDSLDTEKTGESNHTVTMQTLICESNCTVTMDTGINESNPTVTPETHNIDSSSAATVDSLNTQGDKINHTVTVKTFGKENNCTVTTETSGTLFSECSHAVPSESTETVTTDSINSANDVKEMADDEPVHKKARLVTAEPERECSRILPKAQDKTECCCVIIPAGGENYSSGTSENVTVEESCEAAASRQDRNIENAESRQDRNIENAESRQDRNIENAESRQDRNIENAESRQDRNIENAESRQDRNIEHTKSRQDKGSEDGASKQNKDEEDNLNRQDKDSEDAINRQDKDSEDAINRQDKDSEDAINRPDKDSSAETQLPLTEIQAGITEYLGVHEGFSAIIKQRYSDFIVNEIDVQDNVVHLTHLEPPEDDDVETAMNCEEAGEVAVDVISEEDKAKIESLVKSGDRKEVINIVAPPDKQSRTNIHLAVKKRYTQLETRTAEVDGQKFIQVMWKTGRSRDKNPNDWPASKKEFKYVKFVLYKENKDTMDAIGLIAKNLKLKESLFQYAGSKDKRAKSSQEVTAQRIHPKKLAFMNKVLWNIGLGNFEYVKEPLKLGQLSGNQFTIVLRNSQGRTEIVDKAMSSLKTVGFINYFGMQRFGTTSVPTHRVGCSLLLGDWEKAVDLILMPRNDGQSKDTFQKVWMETRDPEATLRVTPRYCGLERNLLEALKRKMKPFNALEKISRNTRLLYIHSYQALVWNQMTSKRLKVLGQKPVVGDLVFPGGSESSENCSPTVITQDNIDQFSLNQVILPLPGHSVVYPDNEVYEWYRQTLASDGLDIDNMKKQQKDYSLPGAYRHIVARPSSVSWSHHRYDDYSLPLTLSDMDVIKGNTLPASQNKGKFKAVILKMTLPSSCYATMALREVMRVDTSAAHQSSMNVS